MPTDTTETPLSVAEARRYVREHENEIKLHTLRIILGISHLPIPEPKSNRAWHKENQK